jgi:CubicO group peptidase (beta-lactamase class C family)
VGQPLKESAQSSHISALLERRVIDARVAPAAAAGLVGPAGAALVGAAGTLPRRAAGVDTLFDLASVSKPIVACTLLRLASRGRLSLEAPLGSLLPEARGTLSQDVPLELFLAHRAGLDGHRPLFAPLFAGRAFERARALETAANARRSDCAGAPEAAGFSPLYSDLGYVLLGATIEAVTHAPLDEVVSSEVAAPLGVELGSARQWRRWRESFADDVAPTEVVAARGGCVSGVVHDENSWALSGHGCSGHAGLFGTVSGVLAFGAALLEALAGRSSWLERDALWTLVKPRAGGTLRAGFDSKSSAASSAGALSSPETFGHLGFTGTSLWCDPTAGVASVLLTNRVHPTRDNPRIRLARPAIHDALFETAKALLPGPPNP